MQRSFQGDLYIDMQQYDSVAKCTLQLDCSFCAGALQGILEFGNASFGQR